MRKITIREACEAFDPPLDRGLIKEFWTYGRLVQTKDRTPKDGYRLLDPCFAHHMELCRTADLKATEKTNYIVKSGNYQIEIGESGISGCVNPANDSATCTLTVWFTRSPYGAVLYDLPEMLPQGVKNHVANIMAGRAHYEAYLK